MMTKRLYPMTFLQLRMVVDLLAGKFGLEKRWAPTPNILVRAAMSMILVLEPAEPLIFKILSKNATQLLNNACMKSV